MNKKLGWLVGLLGLLMLLGGASVLYTRMSDEEASPPVSAASTETEATEEGAMEAVSAPDFTVLDSEGNSVSLSDFFDKPIILNFWASWCSPCKSEMPDFDAAYQQYGEEIQFLMVNLTDGVQETLESAKTFIADSSYSFPVFFDTEYSAAIAYGATSIPATYFVNPEGNLVAYGVDPLNTEDLETGIGMITESAE